TTDGQAGPPGRNTLASKTGFTNGAGGCVSMRGRAARRTVMVVLMGALRSSERALDALNVRRWLAGEAPLPVLPGERKTRRMATAARHAPAAEVSPPQQGSDAADSSAPAAAETTSAAETDADQSVK